MADPTIPETPAWHDYADDLDTDCDNCGGEGFYYDCDDEIGCIDPEGGCDLCRRRCDWCNPKPRNRELDEALFAALRPHGGGNKVAQSGTCAIFRVSNLPRRSAAFRPGVSNLCSGSGPISH